MATLPGDNASYLGIGTHAARPDPTNVAPNAVVRYYESDTKQWCDWVNGEWLCLTAPPNPSPPAPGPGLDQWSCNVAGYITYEVLYKLVKAAVDTNVVQLGVNAIIAAVFDSLSAFLPEFILLDQALLTTLENLVADFVTPYITQFTASLLDDVLWSKIHCYIYRAVAASPSSLSTAFTTAAAALAVSTITPGQVVRGVVLLLQHFGATSVGPIPLSAIVKQYNCTDCAVGGQATGPGIASVSSDLVVSDATNRVAFVQEIHFPNAVLSGTSPEAVVTTPSLELSDGTTDIPAVSKATVGSVFVVGGTAAAATLDLKEQLANLGLFSPDGSMGTPSFRRAVPADLTPSGTNGDVLSTVAGASAWHALPPAGYKLIGSYQFSPSLGGVSRPSNVAFLPASGESWETEYIELLLVGSACSTSADTSAFTDLLVGINADTTDQYLTTTLTYGESGSPTTSGTIAVSHWHVPGMPPNNYGDTYGAMFWLHLLMGAQMVGDHYVRLLGNVVGLNAAGALIRSDVSGIAPYDAGGQVTRIDLSLDNSLSFETVGVWLYGLVIA